MVKLNELMDIDALVTEIDSGFVSRRSSDDNNLAILNYTPAAQYARRWNEITKQSRGLIYDVNTLEVLARPFPKFFNWDEGAVRYPPPGPVLRMPKMDGSLGILYMNRYAGTYQIATRGSLSSEQALWATRHFHMVNHNNKVPFQPVHGKTYLFEIIYPGNKIVVDYGDAERLVLLDVIDNETGFMDTDEFDSCSWPDKVWRQPLAGFDSGQVDDIPQGEEGFVYAWPTRNFRTKMKSAEYVIIHRLVFGLNKRRVWEYLVKGEDLDRVKAALPEEFQDYIDREATAIYRALNQLIGEAHSAYAKILSKVGGNPSRKAFAMEAKQHPMSKYLFLLHDGKSIYDVAMQAVRPDADDLT